MLTSDVRRIQLVVVFLALLVFAPLAVLAQETERAIVATPDSPVPSYTAPPPAVSADTAVPPAASPVAVVRPAISTDPEALGDSMMLHKRYQEAIADYGKARASATVWNKMGIAYQMMFNLKDSMRCYKESLKLAPNNASVLNNLATAEDSLKQYGAAEKLYRKALKIDPKSALVLKNLGTNLLSQHKYDKGWAVYKQALAADPSVFQDRGSPQVQNATSVQQRGAMNYYMALGCAQMGHVDCALEYLRMALNEGFTNPKKVASDVAFSSLRDNPDFKELLAEQESTKAPQAR
jgi:tetratricopeptide (TPR) repeat protein